MNSWKQSILAFSLEVTTLLSAIELELVYSSSFTHTQSHLAFSSNRINSRYHYKDAKDIEFDPLRISQDHTQPCR